MNTSKLMKVSYSGNLSSLESHCFNNQFVNIDERILKLINLRRDRNIIFSGISLFIDVEFNIDGSFRYAHTKAWKYNIRNLRIYDIWNNNSGKNKLTKLIEQADHIFMYGAGNDIRALKEWGLNIKYLQYKLIDIQQLLYVLHPRKNRLNTMSKLYGGPVKYYKKSSANKEVRKQCISDVKMLEFLVIQILNGKILKGSVFKDYFKNLQNYDFKYN